MTAGSRREDKHEPGDALDRAIDETLDAAMHAHVVDLRARVLAGLDEPTDAPAAWWRFVLRPALLSAVGSVLLIVGVVFAWRHVDDTLARIGSRQPTASVARASLPPSPVGPQRTSGPSSSATLPFDSGASGPRSGHPEQRRGVKGRPATVHVLPSPLPPSPSGLRRTSVPSAAGDRVILAASLLEMDAASKPAGVAADTVLMGDDATAAPALPGAVGGNLGDPIKPMPPLRPIVIQPIVAAPIVEAPPISTLAPLVETIPTVGDLTRDPNDPGKPGGVRQ